MKRLFFALALVCAAALPACQCDDPPDIGPVEDASLTITAPVFLG